MDNVFHFRDQLISEYSTFSRSFSKIAATDISAKVEQEYAEGRYWPEPLIQINPYIVPRMLELTYTAHDLAAWAQDLGHSGPPFPFDPDRRVQLRAEFDAYYAHLYGLTRDELRYILDPSDVVGNDYPSETFRVLKNGELREFGEFRTQRLVLEAWDQLEKESQA